MPLTIFREEGRSEDQTLIVYPIVEGKEEEEKISEEAFHPHYLESMVNLPTYLPTSLLAASEYLICREERDAWEYVLFQVITCATV